MHCADTDLKQAQITPIGAMKLCDPIMRLGEHGDLMNPEIGQTGGQQQPRQALRLREMAFVDMQPTTFMVGKQTLNPKAHAIALRCVVGILQRRDQLGARGRSPTVKT